MAQIKLAEYTFDNSVGDVMPSLTPNTITMTSEDTVSGITTRRIVYIDNATMPTQIGFSVKEPLLTVDYLNIDSNITSMYKLFHNAKNLTYINVDNWNTSNVTNLYQCFYGTTALTQNIDFTKMDFAKVTNWYMLFAYSSFPRIDLSHVSPTTKSTDREFFGYCNAEYINISGWTFTNTTSGLFSNATQLKTVVLNNVTTTGVTNMGAMFRDCYNLKTIDVSSFDTSSVVNFANMFHNCSVATEIKGIENFNVSSVQNFSNMFNNCSSLTKLDLRNWVTSSATTFQDMFASCHNLEIIRVDNFDTSKVTGTGLNAMFSYCKKVKTLNLNSFTHSGSLGNFNGFCSNCSSLEYISMQNFAFGNCTSMDGTFTNCTSLKMLDLTTLDSSTFSNKAYGIGGIIKNITCPVYYNSNTCSSTDFTDIPNKTNLIGVKGRLLAIYTFDHTVSNLLPITGGYTVDTITDNITHRVLSSESMKTISFYRQSNLRTVEYMCVPNTTTSLAERFKGCTGLTSVNTFGWDTSNVTTISSLFEECSQLTTIDLSYCDLKNVENLYSTFYYCSGLETLHLPTTFTTKLISLGRTFFSCSKLSVVTGLSEIDTSKVSNFDRTFEGVTSLMEIDLSKWDTSSATGSFNMFGGWTSDQIVYVHDTNWTLDTSSYNATFVRLLSKLLAKYTFDNSIGDCLPIFTGITTSDYMASDMVNENITTRILSTDSEKTITKISFDRQSALLTLDYLNIDKNITQMNDMFGVCSNVTSINATDWDTSNVTNMGYMFQACGKLTEIIGLETWDTSKVEYLNQFFTQCYKITDISGILNWDVSNCKSFAYMFGLMTGITGELDLSNWKPINLESTQNMFPNATFTSINLSGWNVPKLSNMLSMFTGHSTSPLQSVNMSNWTMETPANMKNMFYNNPNLTSIDFTGSKMVSSNLQQTFQSCTKLTSLDVSGFDTSQCTSIQNTFTSCSLLTEIIGLDNWDISNVTNMNQVFAGCTVLANLDSISNWNTSEALYMYGVFSGCKGLTSLNINGWDVGKATILQSCFSDLVMDSLDLSNWNVSRVSNFGFLFSGAKIKNINVSGWDTSAGTNFQYLFTSSTAFKEVDLSGWKVSSDANLLVAFNGCSTSQTIYYDPLLWQNSRQTNITWTVRPSKNNGYWLDMTGITGATEITLFNENNLPTEEILTDWGDGTQNSELTHTYSTAGEYVVVSNLQNGNTNNNMKGYLTKANIYYCTTPDSLFFTCSKLKEVNLTDNWVEKTIAKYGKNVSLSQVFYGCTNLETANTIQLTKFKPTHMVGTFYNCKKIKEIDLTGLDTSSVKGFNTCFATCESISEVKGMENWDTSSATDMSSMFAFSFIPTLNLSSWDFSKVTTMYQFAKNSRITSIDLSNTTFNNTRFTEFLYDNRYITTVNLSGANISGNMESMFLSCSKLENINLTNAIIKPSSLKQTFGYCSLLTSLDAERIDVSSCMSMEGTFKHCSSLTSLDLSSWDTSSCTSMSNVFDGCSSLTSLNLSSWDTDNVTSVYLMFNGCSSIEELDLSSFTTTKLTSIAYMLERCSSLKTLDISNFNLDKFSSTQMFYGTKNIENIGLLYVSSHTVNLISQQISKDNGKQQLAPITIYYYDADPSQLTPVEGVTFKKYAVPTTIQLPPHIQLHSLPDGTRDEVDIKTGILTRNVGVYTLTVSSVVDANQINAWTNYTTDYIGVYIYSNVLSGLGQHGSNVTSSRFGKGRGYPIQSAGVSFSTGENPYLIIAFHRNMLNIDVNDKNNKSLVINKFYEWLKNNPITLMYDLTTPTTEQLILNYNNSCDYGRILPTGMCDKYDVVNSMYTQTMTSILLDGANTWDAMEEFENTVKFTATGTTVGVEELNMLGAGGLYCDNDLFPNINDDSDVEHCRVDEAGNKFYIYISKDRLMSPDLIGWQIWLQANKFNLIYELAEHLTYIKPYEELDATQARWEGMDCMRDGAIKYHANNSDNITMYPTLEYVAPSINNFEVTMLEPNTEYTIYAKGINDNDTINLGGNDINFNNGTVYTSGDNQWLRIDNNDSFYNMVVTKGDTTGEHVPYFEGMASVKMPVLTTTGRNVFNEDLFLTYENIGYKKTSDGYTTTMYYLDATYYPLQLKPNTTYYLDKTAYEQGGAMISIKIGETEYTTGNSGGFDGISYGLKTFTTDDTGLIHIKGGASGYGNIGQHYIEHMWIHEGENAIPFEPHKSNILTVNEEVELRGIGDVKDELNLLTGELTQRLINMSNLGDYDMPNYTVHDVTEFSSVPVLKFSFNLPFKIVDTGYGATNNFPLICDKFKIRGDENGYSVNRGSYVSSRNNQLFLHLIKEEVGLPTDKTITKAIVKEFLKENPIEVTSRLVEPIIKTVDLKCVNQAGEVIDNLCAFDDGTIHLSSDTGLLPTTHYSVPSTNTFNLASMKTGTRYTLKYPSASGSINIGNISYKITSPSMLFMTPLTINGDKSAIVFTDENPQEVVLIEGDYSKREVPFFEGLRSSENIVLTTTDGESTTSVETNTTLRSLPNGLTDKLDLVSGQLIRVAGLRDYQEGDLENSDVYTDGFKTVYPLPVPTETTLKLTKPQGYVDGTIELTSDALIPTLHYRLPSSNNYVLDLLKPETQYTLYANYELDGSFTLGGTTTQTTGNAKVFSTANTLTDTNLTFNGDLDVSNIMLVEGDSTEVTTPHFNGLLSVENATITLTGSATEVNRLVIPDTVKLRSIGTIIDELDLITGVYTKRIESVELTGSENWQLGTHQSTDYLSFRMSRSDLNTATLTNIRCDRFNPLAWTTLTDKTFEFITGNGTIEINIRKDRLTTPDTNGFKRWLKKNPTIVHYELKTPTMTTLNLSWSIKPVSAFFGSTTVQSTGSQTLKPYLQAIIPITSLEEMVASLKDKNAALEEENLSTMLALTEIFEMMMYIMPMESTTLNIEAPTGLNNKVSKGGFQMVEVYATLIIKGKKTLEDVPVIIRPQVKALLIELGALEG